MKFIFLYLITYLLLISSILTEQYKSGLRRSDFQKVLDGKKTDLYTLINKNGYEVSITNYGGAIAAIMAPDKDNKFMNVAQGHDSIDHIISCSNQFLSTLIGRYGNRISDGIFYLDGEKYILNLNDGKNSLHGGPTGFHVRVWDVELYDEHSVKMSYFSKNGEENFPGNLKVEVTFSLNDENEFKRLQKLHPFYAGLEIVDKDEQGLVFKCKRFDKQKRICTIHLFRSAICRKYPSEEIFKFHGVMSENCGYYFKPIESFQTVLNRLQTTSLKNKTDNQNIH